MERIVAVLVVVLVVGSVVAGPATGREATGATADPRLDVTVDGSPVEDGSRHETGADDRIRVEASVSDAAPAGTTLAEIVVRVDGERRASWSVNGTSATEQVRPEFDEGNNTVRVIVTDTADNVNSTQFTVYKDTEAPHLWLTEPYETAPYHDIPDGNVTGTNHTLEGLLADDSRVKRVTVVHTVSGERTTASRRDPGENVSIPLALGYTPADDETNDVRIDVIDEFGNTRTYIFSVDTVDGGPPNLSVQPLPNETTRNRVPFNGTVRDDVWVASAEVTVESLDGNGTDTTTILGQREYEFGRDGRTVPFNESLYVLYPGTYRVTVNATDAAGESASETYTIERVPHDEIDRSPTVEVDRDRTVVTSTETLFVSGSSFEGVTSRLVIETRDATGETVDYQVVHGGSNRDRVDFDREVAIDDGLTAVIVRATGPDGTEVTERFLVNGSSQETFLDASRSISSRAVSVTHLQDDRTGTASSSVRVARLAAGSTVALPPADGPSTVATTGNVTLTGLNLSVGAETNLTGTVVVRDRRAGTLAAPPNTSAAATVSIQHSVPDEQVDGLTMDLRVNRSYLATRGVDPANLTMYRGTDGWTELDTTLVETTNDTARYRVESPGLSVFSLAETGATLSQSDDGTDSSADNGTATNETTDGSADEPTGEAQILVTNVSVNRTQVQVNESVMVNATLENRGDAAGSYTATLQTIQGLNRSVAGKRTAEVPPGEQRTLRFTTRFADPGNHTVSVNGTQAGPVVVSSGGGLLSIFAFLPVRLIGMVLGGIVGLLVVLTLVRFVLRRVGDGGDEAGG